MGTRPDPRPAVREPGSQEPAAALTRPTLPPAIARDVERIRLAEIRRAAKAARQAKGMTDGR